MLHNTVVVQQSKDNFIGEFKKGEYRDEIIEIKYCAIGANHDFYIGESNSSLYIEIEIEIPLGLPLVIHHM